MYHHSRFLCSDMFGTFSVFHVAMLASPLLYIIVLAMFLAFSVFHAYPYIDRHRQGQTFQCTSPRSTKEASCPWDG
jgi:hypothetical protein